MVRSSYFISFCLSFLAFLAVYPSNAVGKAAGHKDYELMTAKALEVTNIDEYDSDGRPAEQMVKLQVLSGSQKGEIFFANNFVPENLAFSIVAKEGGKYIVAFEKDSQEMSITDYYREPIIISLIIAFFLLLIIIGAGHGVKAIVSLILTGLAIVYVLVPWIIAGINPVLGAILISMFATAVTMVLIAGFTKKSLAATIGTTGGVAIAGFIALFIIKIAPLSGLASEEAIILLGNLSNSPERIHLDFQGMLAAGVLISSLGAAMDVAISIASSTQEIYLTDPNQSKSSLFKHSINVGKDIMGTMANTLILAYAGSALPLFILLALEASSTGLKFLNMEIIATEITAATVGSIGLLFSIPLTAIISTFLFKYRS